MDTTSADTNILTAAPRDSEPLLLEAAAKIKMLECKVAHLEIALETARSIGAATGVLMGVHKVTQDEAFAMLRECSQRSNRKLRDVALDVLDTGVIPDSSS